jgi:hypothetical protein
VCIPTGPGGHEGRCDFRCEAGLLRCGDGCCAPALVAAGGEFSCASSTGGEVHCFGANAQGQLGDGRLDPRATARAIDPARVSGVTALTAGGAHACAITSAGPRCWGARAAFRPNLAGVAIDPEAVPSLAGATAISAGQSHTCAIVGGGARCVGATAEAGGGSPDLGGTVVEIAAGDAFTCALVEVGAGANAVKCWGDDAFGQLGDLGAAGLSSATPLTVAVPSTVVHIAAGARHACAGTATGDRQTLWCWGDNSWRQLGDFLPDPAIYPPSLNGRVDKPIAALSGGGRATCALELDAPAYALGCWSSDPGVSGGVSVLGEPNHVAAAGTPFAFSAGALHTCFVDAALTPPRLKCFGNGGSGRLGDGEVASSASPVLVLDR